MNPEPIERLIGASVRISRLSVINFRGVREFELSDFGAITVLTGQNATGKSTILEALHHAMGGQLQAPKETVVGPHGHQAIVEASFTFDDREADLLSDGCRDRLGRPAQRRSEYVRRVTIQEGRRREVSEPEELGVAFSLEFKAQHEFTDVAFVGSDELFAMKNRPTIGLGMPFNPRTTVRSHTGWNHPTADTEGYLAALDYQAMLAAREGRPVEDGFATIAEHFRKVTDRQLLRPASTRAAGSTHISVALSDGRQHGLEELSPGTRNALGLLCLGHYLRSTGAIALLDEPTNHLHPALEVSLFTAFADLTSSAQTMVVTHSAHVVASVPAGCVIEVARSSEDGNQARRPAGPDGPSNPVGLDLAGTMLAEFQVVVEGPGDESDLRLLFPDEMGRAKIVKAGNSNEVLRYHRFHGDAGTPMPWICLLDRDLRTQEEVAKLTAAHPNLHVWPLRAIESMVLYPPLLAAVYSDNGVPLSEARAEHLLREAAQPLQRNVVEALMHEKINRLHPQPKPAEFTSAEEFFLATAQVAELRARAVKQVRADQEALVEDRWETEWLALADPKALLPAFHSKQKLYAKYQLLRAALMTRAGQDASVRPPGLEEFRVRLSRLRGVDAGPAAAAP
ncbi:MULTISPECIES: AAA family ATPase [unclassified Kitasatospora]|uniref:ATP-dependent nuclease n=1 Tax=unclassified Kitasatospora TaxID=2633591 RepID=UPI0033D4AF8C